ncbi:cadherin repeat domain-containing protein, partial [Microvirga sp. BT350]
MPSPIVKIGDETQVNVTTTGDQSAPSIKALADGGWVVVWQSANQDGSGWGIFQQRYDQDGKALGTADQLVNITTPKDQTDPCVTALTDGGWVVTWTSGDPYDGDVYQQRYDKNGHAVFSADKRVNTTTTYDQSGSSVTALADGGWVVTWHSFLQDGSSNGVYQQRYDATGNPVGVERAVNVLTDGNQYRASVTSLTDGGWVVTWESHSGAGSNTHHLFQQRFDKDGNATSPTDITVEGNTADYKLISSVTGLTDGGWVVTWTSYNNGDLYQQRFDKYGHAVFPLPVRVNITSTDAQEPAVVTALADGGWVVVWESGSHDGSGEGIYLQQFDKDGKAVYAADQRVNATIAGDQKNPSVTALPGGGWVVVWESANQDGSGYGIYHRYYLTDTNRAPTDVTLSRDTVDEGTTGVIATLDGVDPDTGETFTFTLAEDASGKFEIVGKELKLKDGQSLDYEAAKSHVLKITVTDHGGRSYTKTVTIHVDDVNEKPTGITLSKTDVDEDATGTIATLTGLDPDAGETFTFTLAHDASGKFEIAGNELRLKAGETLDYGVAKSHTITIKVTDHGGLSYTKTVTIDVNYVAGKNHVPTHVTLNGGTAATVNENSDESA